MIVVPFDCMLHGVIILVLQFEASIDRDNHGLLR